MSNKVLSVKKKSSMRKVAIILMIAIFFVCSLSTHVKATKTKVDPEKWTKLTSEQKETFKKNAEKARDTHLEAAKTHDEVAKKAEKIKKTLETVKKAGEAAQNALKKKDPN